MAAELKGLPEPLTKGADINSFAKLVCENSRMKSSSNSSKGPLELLTHLYHDLGIQSNVLVFAEYTKDGQILTKSKVLKALAVVINDQSALSIIGVSQPSEKKEGNHRLWEARLPALRIQDCVEFLEIQGNLNASQVF